MEKERGGEKLENGFLLPLKNLNFREKSSTISKGLFQQKMKESINIREYFVQCSREKQ